MKFTAEGDQINLSSTEERIDDLVFKCFGLTEEEKSVVMDFYSSKKSKVQDLEFNDLTD